MKRHSVFAAALLATLLMAIPTQSQAFFFSFGFGGGGWGGPGWWGPGYGYWHRPYRWGWRRPYYRRWAYPSYWGYSPWVLPNYPVLTVPAAPAAPAAPATSAEK